MNPAIVVTLCLGLVAAAGAYVANPEWEAFKVEYGRTFRSPTEELFRKKIFLNNKLAIDQQNQLYAEGRSTFTMGINQFSDLTNLEYREMLNQYEAPARPDEITQSFDYSDVSIPTTVDWRTSSCVSPVKDQGQCGSCWAFSASGAVEFYRCRARSTMIRLSEQELVDCSTGYGNDACNGGWVDNAFRYMIDNGISCEACYNYTATFQVCSKCVAMCATLSGLVDITPYNSEPALTTNVANVGVVSVAIDAGQPTFQSYQSGVYNDPRCTKTVNHAVLVVGYGVEYSTPFYMVKNSWGTGWGQLGYIKMTRNGSNQCCIACYPSYPVLG